MDRKIIISKVRYLEPDELPTAPLRDIGMQI